jgi:hypothetical protein
MRCSSSSGLLKCMTYFSQFSSSSKRDCPQFRSALGTCVVAFALALSPFFVVRESEAAARPRAGQACTNRQIGVVIGSPGIICNYLTPCRGRSKFIWVPMGPNGAFPSRATLIRYGQCPTPVTTTTATPVLEGSGTGVRCLVGNWRFEASDMKRFLVEASGTEQAGDGLSGSMRYRFSGEIGGDQIASGAATGEGQISGGTPDGLVRVVVNPAVGTQFQASNNTIQFRNAIGLFDIAITVNGASQPPYEVVRSGREIALQNYECSGDLVRFIVEIPGAAGQPARRAAVVLQRG